MYDGVSDMEGISPVDGEHRVAWSPGQLVRHIDDPAKSGTVTDQTRSRASGSQFRVNWNARLDWHYAEELMENRGQVGMALT